MKGERRGSLERKRVREWEKMMMMILPLFLFSGKSLLDSLKRNRQRDKGRGREAS